MGQGQKEADSQGQEGTGYAQAFLIETSETKLSIDD